MTTRIGIERGNMMLKTMVKGLAPSMNAASSSSFGRAMMKFLAMIRYQAFVARGSIRASRDPISPRRLIFR